MCFEFSKQNSTRMTPFKITKQDLSLKGILNNPKLIFKKHFQWWLDLTKLELLLPWCLKRVSFCTNLIWNRHSWVVSSSKKYTLNNIKVLLYKFEKGLVWAKTNTSGMVCCDWCSLQWQMFLKEQKWANCVHQETR